MPGRYRRPMGDLDFASMPGTRGEPGATVIAVPDPREAARARELRRHVDVLRPRDLRWQPLVGALPVLGGAIGFWLIGSDGLVFPALLPMWIVLLLAPVLMRRFEGMPLTKDRWAFVAGVVLAVLAYAVDLSAWPPWPGERLTRAMAVGFLVVSVVLLARTGTSTAASGAAWSSGTGALLRSSPGLAILLTLEGVKAVSGRQVAAVLGMPESVAVAWLRTLTSLGLARADRQPGWWAITPVGRRLLDEHLDPR